MSEIPALLFINSFNLQFLSLKVNKITFQKSYKMINYRGTHKQTL